MNKVFLSAIALGLAIGMLPYRARAQASAALLVKPWDVPGAAEDTTTGLFLNPGHVQGRGNGFQLSVLESEGRARFLPNNVASPRIGYDVTLLNTHTSLKGDAQQRGFPSQLLDASFAFGTFLAKYNDWVYGVTLGAGYAGDHPFDTGRAWYAHCDFVVARKFSENDALGIGLDYDGHRSYLPDCPLPGFGWSHTLDPHWDAVIGAPISSITWHPDDHWRLYFDYLVYTDLDADISYKFLKHWAVFTSFQTRRDQFYISELHGHTRLLYGQKRAEGGVRFQPMPSLTISGAIGYAFSTDFRRGWDYRSTSQYVYVSNEPYLRIGVDFRF